MALFIFTSSALLFFAFNFYQDFKTRTIYLVNLPIAILFTVVYSFVIHYQFFKVSYLLINLIILGLQFAILCLYLLFNHKFKISNLTNYIAIADIVFLIIPALYFNPVIYILFEITLLLLSILLTTIIKSRHESVPLAGFIGLGLALVFAIESFTTIRINDPLIFDKLLIFY